MHVRTSNMHVTCTGFCIGYTSRDLATLCRQWQTDKPIVYAHRVIIFQLHDVYCMYVSLQSKCAWLRNWHLITYFTTWKACDMYNIMSFSRTHVSNVFTWAILHYHTCGLCMTCHAPINHPLCSMNFCCDTILGNNKIIGLRNRRWIILRIWQYEFGHRHSIKKIYTLTIPMPLFAVLTLVSDCERNLYNCGSGVSIQSIL